ncbi:MAG: tRNA preQ1(34) S-adenosylmethionine ribosyltransferase-isomerase QueA [Pyrinomonadaceae bacterium]
MHLSDFDFFLPDGLIAQKPAAQREGSRLMIVDRSQGTFFDGKFVELADLLLNDDLLVINNTKVFPARLLGDTETGASIETFLVQELEPSIWEVLARPAKRLKLGKILSFGNELSAIVVEKKDDGKVVIKFETNGDLMEAIDRVGRTPLPPYIKRTLGNIDSDRERYQTVYAKNRGAIAAPTAGLHFTPEILQTLREKGIEIAEITLHVGYGTFEPVRVDDLSKHRVLPEKYEIDEAAADILNRAKAQHRRIVAVGTTTTRALESNIDKFDRFAAGRYAAGLTITPGYEFRAVDAMLTNFHLPKSSLLILTSVFGGHQLIMDAYRHAVTANYRFYSYGDCMLII